MSKEFLGKRLVVFTAHPDDEGLAAGTMYRNNEMGGKTFLICATAGEKGRSHLKKAVSDTQLKKIRRNELLKAAKILKIDEVIFLDLPDAKVRENEKKLFAKSLPLIKRLKPDHILSFGPDGISGHWDHIITGKIALKIAKLLKVPLFAFTLSQESAIRRKKVLLARRKFGAYAFVPKHRKSTVDIKVSPDIKAKAFKQHKSQFPTGTPYPTLPKRIIRNIMSHEHFVEEVIG